MSVSVSQIANYLKQVLPVISNDNYTINPYFLDFYNEKNIRLGILAYRNFLVRVCDKLIDGSETYSSYIKYSKGKEHLSLLTTFPFLDYIKSVLINIAYRGVLDESMTEITIEDISELSSIIGMDGQLKKAKISKKNLINVLTLLENCGLIFACESQECRSYELLVNKKIKLTYTRNENLFIGLKVMAKAQNLYYKKGFHDIFLRCDYRMLSLELNSSFKRLEDVTSYLPESQRNFLLSLHKRYVNTGLVCEFDAFYMAIRFTYSLKNKEVFSIMTSFDSGLFLLIKAKNMSSYHSIVDNFPIIIQNKISKGFGCNRKLYDEPCQKGCHGFSFPVDVSVESIKLDLIDWIDAEVAYYLR